MDFSYESDWLGHIFSDVTDDERAMYYYWLRLREIEHPELLLEKYNGLYLDCRRRYQDREVESVLFRLIEADGNGEESRPFLDVLNCCSHILANHWRKDPKNHHAIVELVELFESIPEQPPLARNMHPLYNLVRRYPETDGYKGLRRFADMYRSYPNVTKATSVRMMLNNFPFLYEVPEILLSNQYKFQRSDIDDIRAIKEEAKEKALLPYYKKWQRNETLTPSLSDTVLDGESLSSAFQAFKGKVAGYATHAEAADSFRNFIRRGDCSYQEFIHPFCNFFLAPIEQEVSSRFFDQQQIQLHDFLLQKEPSFRYCAVKDWLSRICSAIMKFLLMDRDKCHSIFINWHGNLQNASMVGLLLRLIHFQKQTKRVMIRCLAQIFNHYGNRSLDDRGIGWLIPFLENVNIAFATNFGKYEFRKYRIS